MNALHHISSPGKGEGGAKRRVGVRRFDHTHLKMVRALVVFFAPLASVSLAVSAECPSNLAAEQLAPGRYRLAAIAANSDPKNQFDADTLYFFNGKCECSFAVVKSKFYQPGESGLPTNEATNATKGGKGTLKLAARLSETKGVCPSAVNTWSPLLQCFNKKAPTCKGRT